MAALSRTSSIATSRSSSHPFGNPHQTMSTRFKAGFKPKTAGQTEGIREFAGRPSPYDERPARRPRQGAPKLIRGIIDFDSDRISLTNDSPSLAITSQSRLNRRKRVKKEPSLSECKGKRYRYSVDMRLPAPVHSKSLNRDRFANHNSPRALKPPAGLKIKPSTEPRQSNNATVHSLPLILPANQDYECHVEWESEEEIKVDAAETLWRKLELECGMIAQQAQASPKRGRWRVKVVNTPIISGGQLNPDSASEDDVLMTRHNTDYVEDTTNFRIIGEEYSRFVGVLREVDDILPSVNDFENLAESLRKSPGKQQAAPTKRSKSQKIVHSDLKRALGSVWEEYDHDEASGWSAQLALLKSRSISKSRSQPEQHNQGENGHWSLERATSAASVRHGETQTMARSITIQSCLGDSLIDMYLES
jgi:hypothetical protein